MVDPMTKLTHQSLVLSFIKISGALLGLYRTRLLAVFFGANLVTDAFVIAWSIPSTVVNLLMGSIYLILIPEIIRLIQQKGDMAESFFWKVQSYIFLFSLCLGGILFFLGEPILKGLYSFETDDQLTLSTHLLWILSPIILCQLMLSSFSSLFATRQVFIFPFSLQLIPLLMGIGGLFLHKTWSIYGLVMGMTAGNIFSFIISASYARWRFHSFRFRLSTEISRFRGYAKKWIPLVFIQIGIQFMFIIDRIMASSLGEGQVSVLHYGIRINEMVFQGLILTFVITVYPLLSNHIVKQNKDALIHDLRAVLLKVVILSVPLTVFLQLAGVEIISFLLGNKNFDSSLVLETGAVLETIALGLIMMGINAVLFRYLIVVEWYKYLLVFGLIQVLLKVALNVHWMEQGVQGFAAATVAVQFVWMVLAAVCIWSQEKRMIKNVLGLQLVFPIIFGAMAYFLASRIKPTYEIFSGFGYILITAASIFVLFFGAMALFRGKDLRSVLTH